MVTDDFNLNKVAHLHHVDVLDINYLANALKPVVLPGEKTIVLIQQEGKEFNQGVGYLDDGTMAVVDYAAQADRQVGRDFRDQRAANRERQNDLWKDGRERKKRAGAAGASGVGALGIVSATPDFANWSVMPGRSVFASAMSLAAAA